MDSLLSIVIPAYNIEKYIGRCLDSLINQTYSNLEIIIVDDGSTDDTSNISDEYAKKYKNIKVIHKHNEGVSIARLIGMKRSEGDYVGFVDGDDVVDNDMFELLMNNANEYKADISHCGYIMDFPDGHSDKYYGTGKRIVQNNEQGLTDLLRGKFIEPGLCNKIYKKSLIDEFIINKNMDYSIKNLEDLLVNYFLFKNSQISIYEDVCKYHYILRKSSAAIGTSINKYTDPIKVYNIIMNFENNKILCEIIYQRYIYNLINNIFQKEYPDTSMNSKILLKKEIKEFKKNHLSFKMTVMSIGICYFTPMYNLVRLLYNTITKIDKKYDV